MTPLIDENKLQFDEKRTKTEKFEKYLKLYIINFKTIRYELTAPGNIIHLILTYESHSFDPQLRELMRPVSNLGLPKEQKQQIQEKI